MLRQKEGLGHLVTILITVLNRARALLILASEVPTEEKPPSLSPPFTVTLRNKEAPSMCLVSLPPKLPQQQQPWVHLQLLVFMKGC